MSVTQEDVGRGRRVAHVMRHYGEPSQTFVADTIRELDALGWEGWVVAGKVNHRDWYPHPPDERVATARPPQPLARLAARLRRRPPLARAAGQYTRFVRAARPAIVHAHFGWAGPLALPAVRRLQVPLVVTFHATDVTVWPYEDEGNRRAYAELFDHVSVAIAVSRFTEGRLREAGWTGPVAIEPAGVSVADFPFRGARARSAEDGEVRLLFIGRLVPRKALDVLLEALARLPQQPPVRLAVIGDGPLRDDHELLAMRLGIRDRVDFLGARSKEDVRAALMDADLLVMSSRMTGDGEAEGSPVALKEALAVGVPIVATDNGGTVEVLPPQLRHEIVPEADPVALAERLRSVIADRPSWPERAALGRRWAEQEFDNAQLARRLSRLYEQALAGR